MPLHITKEIHEQQTELFIQQFGDRMLILVTQMGKVGTLIQATVPPTTPFAPQAPSDDASNAALPEPPVSIVLTPLMGTSPSPDHKTLLDIYASQIATLAWSSNPSYRSPVVVGLAMKKQSISLEDGEIVIQERNREVFFEVMKMVNEGLKQLRSQ
ncbi:hypothetical protein M408DRAFT_326672 [Serendipita vermifera MAFF 305830]|uniref:Uncharacterized protein n=1 Tax=Serendipita vermifera MAFF 305830 TaxID=933852 RepID=A0A0C2X4C8_SERVB|nr:hypothetical protein M408DRAFT_326672 [Serendipita vermifera MAFF 305830]